MALGATQWQTIWKQVLPAAIPGIATGAILALSRAIGEAAPLIMVGGAAFATRRKRLLQRVHGAAAADLHLDLDAQQEEFAPLAAAAIIVLLGVLLAMNAVAIWLRNRYQQQW